MTFQVKHLQVMYEKRFSIRPCLFLYKTMKKCFSWHIVYFVHKAEVEHVEWHCIWPQREKKKDAETNIWAPLRSMLAIKYILAINDNTTWHTGFSIQSRVELEKCRLFFPLTWTFIISNLTMCTSKCLSSAGGSWGCSEAPLLRKYYILSSAKHIVQVVLSTTATHASVFICVNVL